MTTATTIRDLARGMAEELRLDADAVLTEIRHARHTFDTYEGLANDSAQYEALCRLVWAAVTEGAEWPWERGTMEQATPRTTKETR